MFFVFRIRISLFCTHTQYSFFENFSSPSHEGNDPTSAWNIWNGFGNSGNRYVAPYAWRSTWIRLRSRWWVELSWVAVAVVVFLLKKRSSGNMLKHLFVGRYHWISPQTEKRHGSIFGFQVSVGEKSQTPQPNSAVFDQASLAAVNQQLTWSSKQMVPWNKSSLLEN